MRLDVDTETRTSPALNESKFGVHVHGIYNTVYVSATAYAPPLRSVVDLVVNKSYKNLYKTLTHQDFVDSLQAFDFFVDLLYNLPWISYRLPTCCKLVVQHAVQQSEVSGVCAR